MLADREYEHSTARQLRRAVDQQFGVGRHEPYSVATDEGARPLEQREHLGALVVGQSAAWIIECCLQLLERARVHAQLERRHAERAQRARTRPELVRLQKQRARFGEALGLELRDRVRYDVAIRGLNLGGRLAGLRRRGLDGRVGVCPAISVGGAACNALANARASKGRGANCIERVSESANLPQKG